MMRMRRGMVWRVRLGVRRSRRQKRTTREMMMMRKARRRLLLPLEQHQQPQTLPQLLQQLQQQRSQYLQLQGNSSKVLKLQQHPQQRCLHQQHKRRVQQLCPLLLHLALLQLAPPRELLPQQGQVLQGRRARRRVLARSQTTC
jgi:hypothetical protein